MTGNLIERQQVIIFIIKKANEFEYKFKNKNVDHLQNNN